MVLFNSHISCTWHIVTSLVLDIYNLLRWHNFDCLCVVVVVFEAVVGGC